MSAAHSIHLRAILLGVLLALTVFIIAGTEHGTASHDTWTIVTSLPQPWDSVAVATAPDGRVCAFGGGPFAVSHPTVQCYDPGTDSWEKSTDVVGGTLTPMPTRRSAAAAVTANNGKIYVIGGQIDTAAGIMNAVEAYDPVADTWETSEGVSPTLTRMPTARTSLAAAHGQNGRIYVAGGHDGSANTTALEIYDPATDKWETSEGVSATLNPMPIGQSSSNGAATGPDGRIYVVGGHYEPGSATFDPAIMQVYNPSTGNWVASPPPPNPPNVARIALAVVTGADGCIYAISGSREGGPYLPDVERYDVDSDSWTPGDGVEVPRYTHGAALGNDGYIYVLGGGDPNPRPEVERLSTNHTGGDVCTGTPKSVGGVALDRELRGLPLESSDSSATGIAMLAGIVAAAVAAGTAALSGIAWYTRRWLEGP